MRNQSSAGLTSHNLFILIFVINILVRPIESITSHNILRLYITLSSDNLSIVSLEIPLREPTQALNLSGSVDAQWHPPLRIVLFPVVRRLLPAIAAP